MHVILFGLLVQAATSFLSTSITRTRTLSAQPFLRAAPQRLDENVEGILYVNDRCINCAACSNFAPTIFERGTKFKHVVYKQPTLQNKEELEEASAALAACPVAAIRVESKVNDKEAELKSSLSIKTNGNFVFGCLVS